ncbi:MAG TPA: hypothetical protein VM818_12005 [Vicinamibacterales bacterium]|nr:hypothetical protein [Vicinamibacterales bacterium]
MLRGQLAGRTRRSGEGQGGGYEAWRPDADEHRIGCRCTRTEEDGRGSADFNATAKTYPVTRPGTHSFKRKNGLDLSVGIALGSASQIALFVAPVLVLLSYVLGPAPMDLRFWPGAVVMMLIATLTASLVTNGGRSTWFVGTLVLMVYLVFAMTLYLLPPSGQ